MLNGINPLKLMELKGRLDKFNENHPRVLPFIERLRADGLGEGTVLEISAQRPDGTKYTCNVKLNADDVETLRMLNEEVFAKQ